MTETLQHKRAQVAIGTSEHIKSSETVLTDIHCILYAFMLVVNCLDFSEAISYLHS